MIHYETFASKPAASSDYEFFVAGFETLGSKAHGPTLIKTFDQLHPKGPFALYMETLRHSSRTKVLSDLVAAGVLSNASIASLPPALENIVLELERSRTVHVQTVLTEAYLASPAHDVPAYLQVLCAAEAVAGSPSAAAHLLGENSPSGKKVLTRHHIARSRSVYRERSRQWLAEHYLPGLDIGYARTALEKLWFRALQKVRLDAKQNIELRRLRGKALAVALDRDGQFWRLILEAANELDEADGFEMQTVFLLVTVDMAVPRSVFAAVA